MKKYLSVLLALSLVLIFISPLSLLATAGDPEPTGKITCFTRTSATAPGQGMAYTYTIGTDAFFLGGNHAMAYSYGGDPTLPKSPHVVYSYGHKTNRLVLSGTGYYVDLTKLTSTLLFANGLETVDKDSKKLVTFEQSVLVSSGLPACTGPIVHLPEPPAPPPDTGGGSDCNYKNDNTIDYGTCSDGIQNPNTNETGIDTGGRCSPGMTSQNGPGSHAALFGHWAHPTRPVPITVVNNLDKIYAQFVPKALRDWNLAGSIVVTEGGADAIRITIENGDYCNTGWVGVTYTSSNGPHIVSALVKLNDHYLHTAQYAKDSERQYTVTHELGHAWGMEHEDVEFSNPNMCSVMDYTGDVDGTKGNQCTNLHPNHNDIDALVNAYNHIP